MGKSTTVILWGADDLIGQGVEIFLRSQEEMEVIRIYGEKNFDRLIEEVGKGSPDVIMINRGGCPRSLRPPLQLLMDHPHIKLVIFSLENSIVEVYNKQVISVTKMDDLLNNVRSNLTSNTPG